MIWQLLRYVKSSRGRGSYKIIEEKGTISNEHISIYIPLFGGEKSGDIILGIGKFNIEAYLVE